jgi:hypothetical protein
MEIVTGAPVLPESLPPPPPQMALRVALKDELPEIPDSVLPGVRALIENCWATDLDDGPRFAAIVYRLSDMEFKVTAGVNSMKVWLFVR